MSAVPFLCLIEWLPKMAIVACNHVIVPNIYIRLTSNCSPHVTTFPPMSTTTTKKLAVTTSNLHHCLTTLIACKPQLNNAKLGEWQTEFASVLVSDLMHPVPSANIIISQESSYNFLLDCADASMKVKTPSLILSASSKWIQADGDAELITHTNVNRDDPRVKSHEWHDATIITPPNSPTAATKDWIAKTKSELYFFFYLKFD